MGKYPQTRPAWQNSQTENLPARPLIDRYRYYFIFYSNYGQTVGFMFLVRYLPRPNKYNIFYKKKTLTHTPQIHPLARPFLFLSFPSALPHFSVLSNIFERFRWRTQTLNSLSCLVFLQLLPSRPSTWYYRTWGRGRSGKRSSISKKKKKAALASRRIRWCYLATTTATMRRTRIWAWRSSRSRCWCAPRSWFPTTTTFRMNLWEELVAVDLLLVWWWCLLLPRLPWKKNRKRWLKSPVAVT